ncbi:Histone deacetylase-like amidohydrolase [Alphaproteobacteria bacterium SO-S41]|nr:Histone deacetylase-like amidohydrolase [Alphaproteobacteria bacterium SO-S41]
MTTALFTHFACLDHVTPPGHPESPERLRAVLEALADPAFAALVRGEALRADPETLALIHPKAFISRVLESVPARGLKSIDGDTTLSPGSGEAALRAAGGVIAAVDAVMTGEAKNAFAAVRPPGHHAEPGTAMGFCVFNNVAVGAQRARASHGLKRVAVVDFDVHHGNGTQAAFERDADLFFASTHQWPLYPGTGLPQERGFANNVLNVPLAPRSGSDEFRDAFEREVLPALDAFAPELVMISAGFDAHAADPLADLRLVEADYAWATARLCEIADIHAKGRVVSTLEGGYDLEALAASAAAHVKALMAA